MDRIHRPVTFPGHPVDGVLRRCAFTVDLTRD